MAKFFLLEKGKVLHTHDSYRMQPKPLLETETLSLFVAIGQPVLISDLDKLPIVVAILPTIRKSINPKDTSQVESRFEEWVYLSTEANGKISLQFENGNPAFFITTGIEQGANGHLATLQ